jgi:hypothetical protein
MTDEPEEATPTNGRAHTLGPWETDARRVAIGDAVRWARSLMDELEEDGGERATALEVRLYRWCQRMLARWRREEEDDPPDGEDGGIDYRTERSN